MFEVGRTLIVLGIFLVIIGALIVFFGKIPGLGKLPGDILIERKNFTFYFPLATSILLSILISFFFWLIGRR
ncbi:MAG: DUF2905 domain-containing protein [Nitrospiria bacterium]